MTDPLLPHLLDIVTDPASEGLILAGGFGLRLKQAYLRATGGRTLIPVIPEARATQDLDFFLSLAFFLQKERGVAVRALLDGLHYTEHTPKYQFGKPLYPDFADTKVKVDLLARSPEPEDGIRVKWPRVGTGSGINLHGRETPEGFAVEESPVPLMVSGQKTDGQEVTARVLVPHPYAWLNLKVKAAHDWLCMERGEIERKPHSEKHVFDVYMLVAMLTEAEITEGVALATRYFNHPQAAHVRQCARELYEGELGEGRVEVRRQTNVPLDFEVFWEAVRTVLGTG